MRDALVAPDRLLYVLGTTAVLVFARDQLARRVDLVAPYSSRPLSSDQIQADGEGTAFLGLLGGAPAVIDFIGLTSLADRQWRRFEAWTMLDPKPVPYLMEISVAYTDSDLLVAGTRIAESGCAGRAVLVFGEDGSAHWELDKKTGRFEADGGAPSIACGRRTCFSFGSVILPDDGHRVTLFERRNGDWVDIGLPEEQGPGYFDGIAVLPEEVPALLGLCQASIRTGSATWDFRRLEFEECLRAEESDSVPVGSPQWLGARTAYVSGLVATQAGLLARLDVTFDDGTRAFAVWLVSGREGFWAAIKTGVAVTVHALRGVANEAEGFAIG